LVIIDNIPGVAGIGEKTAPRSAKEAAWTVFMLTAEIKESLASWNPKEPPT
jgi:5'-3' exonuclease